MIIQVINIFQIFMSIFLYCNDVPWGGTVFHSFDNKMPTGCFNRIFPVALFCVENSIFSSKICGSFLSQKYKYSAYQGRLLLFDPFWFILKEDTFNKHWLD